MDDEDIPFEELLAFSRAAKLMRIRGSGAAMSIETINRWALKGCGGTKLKWVQVGASKCTTRHWLTEFVAQLTAARTTELPRMPAQRERDIDRELPRTPAHRERDIDRAVRELDDASP